MQQREDGPPTAYALPPLADARLTMPRLRNGVIDRARVHDALEGDPGVALVLVAAPPGYGKTTAVRAWCAQRDVPAAWVTLDTDDDDPARLWTYVATALDHLHGGLGRATLERLAWPTGTVDMAVDELSNAIAAHEGELVLVLDELERVTSRDALESIDRALDRFPANLRLVALTRSDPMLQLARLRARGALREVRADTLAFTSVEAGAVLESLGCAAVGATDLERLHERTDGWPAAIVMTGMWLADSPDPHSALDAFGADQRFIAEYLSQEVLASLDPDVRAFLLRASVLRELSADLCDAALERSDSAAVLERLAAANALVERLEHGGWFRIHALFAEFAALQLDASEPGVAAELHRRAARWLRSQGLPSDALSHAMAAEDTELVAEIMVEFHLPFIRTGRARTLLDVVATLPDSSLAGRPELAAAAAAAAAIAQPQGTIERRRLLGLVERARVAGPASPSYRYADAVAAMVRAATVDDDVSRAVTAGRHATAIAEAEADDVLVAALAGLSRALYLDGKLDAAQASALRAVEHPDAERRAPGQLLARSTLALVAADRGRRTSARAHAEKARLLAATTDCERGWLGASVAVALGAVLEAEGDLAAAERELAHAERRLRDDVATAHHVWSLLLLSRVRGGRGRLDEAFAALHEAETELVELRDAGCLGPLADTVRSELTATRARAAGSGDVLDPPSPAELAVLRLLPSELSAREIGAQLFLSHNTVRSHTSAIYRKLGVRSRADAVARATMLGLIGTGATPESSM